MNADLIISIAGATIFLIGAARFGFVAHHSRLGTLPYKSKLGIRHPAVHATETAWKTAHTRVWIMFALGCGISAFHGIALAFAPYIEGIGLRSYNMVLILAGGVVILAITVLADKAGAAALE